MFPVRSFLAAGLVLAAAPLHAQTAAQDYYAELKALYQRMGMSFAAASEELSGESLVLRDVSFSYTAADVTVTGSGGDLEIRPAEQEGYSLVMVWPERMEFSGTFSAPDVSTVDLKGFMEMPGNVTLIGGEPGERTYDFSADSIRLEYEPFTLGPDDGTMGMAIAMTQVAGTGISTDVNDGAYEYKVGAGNLSIALAIAAADGGMNLTASYTGVSMDAKGPLIGMVDPTMIYSASLATDGRMDIASSESRVEVIESGLATVITSTSGKGSLVFRVGEGQIDYGLDSDANVIEVTGDAMPFPTARLEAYSMGFRLAMPVVPQDKPGLMALDLELEGLTISEEIWAMADPAGGIPRVPATLILRARSAASPLVNFMDPAAMENAPPEAALMPFRFDTLSIKELKLVIAGVELRATGEAAIRNEGPVPQPVGGMDVTIEGAIGLATRLSEIGLIPPEQAQAAPMMLGTFAKPGAKEDSFTSRIEFTEDGQITANGVPLQ